MIAEPRTAEQVQANQREAETLRCVCPRCSQPATKVRAAHRQATRREPCQLLGVEVYCSCEPDFLSGCPLVAHIAFDEVDFAQRSLLA